MKKLLVVLSTIVLVVVGYLGGVYYYSNKFVANSYYGQVEVSGLTVAQAIEKIEREINAQDISIKEGDKTVAKVKLGDAEVTYDLKKSVTNAYNAQNPAMWLVNFVQGSHYDGVTGTMVKIDTEKLQSLLESQGLENEERKVPTDAKIAYSETEGYKVVNGKIGTQVDFALLGAQIVNQAGKGATSVDLTQSYLQPTIDEKSETITSVMDGIHHISDKKITLKIAGEQVMIPSKLIESWIYFDDANKLVLDEALVASYLDELNEKYSTFDKERKFKSTLQGEVTVPPGILGWKIDTEQELPQLIADLQGSKMTVTREPAIYSTGGVPNAKDDIGDNYVEVDITNQMMYLYKNGKSVLSSDVVTGQPDAPTVPGANVVIEMLTDTKLRGYNPFYKKEYAVDVNYWIRFDNNAQGIHDAPWQSQFGGDTYTWSGSLGCVNTPYDNVAYIYENVDYGTPVIVFE